MTNFERIKAMSVEEMAILLSTEIPHGDCYGCTLNCHGVKPPYRLGDSCDEAWLMWLESEVQDGNV